MSGAPICHVPGSKPTIQTPTSTMPSVPIATTDINSLVSTVNMLRQMVLRLSGQDQSGLDNPNQPRPAPKIPQEQKRVQYSETQRTTEKVKIYQNNDKTSENWIEVEMINTLQMTDKNTGQTWEWRRKR